MTLRNTVSALLLAWTMMGTTAAYADTVALTPDHPERYTVVKGDTLWDISSRFLRDPWLWPEIWQINTAIENPHLIYPGDVVVLTMKDGKPELQLERAWHAEIASEEQLPAVKLEPTMRVSDLDTAIPTIPMDAIQQFLTRTRVVSKAEADKAPYIVSMEEGRLVGGAAHLIYARGIPVDSTAPHYGIYRIGDPYHNPGTKKESGALGYEAMHIAYADVKETGDPTTLLITSSTRETLPGDRLFAEAEGRFNRNFVPHAPKNPVEGRIIAVQDAISRVGQYQVTVINLGQKDGMEPGLVLAVYQTGDIVRDTVKAGKSESVKLPDVHAGVVMVFRTFDQVSYALVMRATRDIRLYDMVKNP